MKCPARVLITLLVVTGFGSVAVAQVLPVRRAKGAEDTPQLEPLPRAAPSPKESPATAAKVSLGRQLFFDKRLSGDNATSCAGCHLPEKAFTDGLPTGTGHKGKRLSRNTPGLLDVGHYKAFLWDGRAQTLKEQALGPIANPDEMNQDLDALVKELNAVPGYVRQFERVFGTKVTKTGIAAALAAFQRTLKTGPSPFDRYLAGDKTALSAAAKRGLELFRGKAGCVRCHHGPMLTDWKFHRLGVSFNDKGRGAVTKRTGDAFKFRTPPLRNIAETGPYMHDGSLKTLTDVVEFYYRNVPVSGPNGLMLDVAPLLDQSLSESQEIVAFLKSLSGTPPTIKPPKLP